jgi:hypothetical protein
MAYLPHDFWVPPTNPPTEEYIENRAEFIRVAAHLPPTRLKALTHLFIHLAPHASDPGRKQDSALIVITPRAATIEYLDLLDSNDKHHVLGDILNVISRVDLDRDSTWLELADWKCRVGAAGGELEASESPYGKKRSTQIYTCTNALGQAFGHDVDMRCVLQTFNISNTYDIIMRRKAQIIALDLFRGYFSNVKGDPQYKPRVKRIFGHRIHEEGEERVWVDNHRQRRNGSPWLHFPEKIYRRFLLRELAQWNGENRWRGLSEEELYQKARVRMRDLNKRGRYRDAPMDTELGEFGKGQEGKRTRKLRRWLEDKDCEGRRVDRYHKFDLSAGW